MEDPNLETQSDHPSLEKRSKRIPSVAGLHDSMKKEEINLDAIRIKGKRPLIHNPSNLASILMDSMVLNQLDIASQEPYKDHTFHKHDIGAKANLASNLVQFLDRNDQVLDLENDGLNNVSCSLNI
jgi:hypothetical protein